MPLVIVHPNCSPTQVDDFPKECKRSREGSVMIRMGSLILTDDELKHIESRHPGCYRHFIVPAPKPQAAIAAASKREGDKAPPVTSKSKRPDPLRVADMVADGAVQLSALPRDLRFEVEAELSKRKPKAAQVVKAPSDVDPRRRGVKGD